MLPHNHSVIGNKVMRSDSVKVGVERAPHRALLRSLGCTDRELGQPFVGIVNSYSEIVPGHAHLRTIAEAVKSGVREAGGTPFEVNTIAICDGIAMNHEGMKYSLPSREVIADSVELVVQAHAFDALVFIPNCDKIIPGMLMAAARLNIPSIFVSGGPMLAGRSAEGDCYDVNTLFMAVGKVVKGEMSEERLAELEEIACPGCGSCAGMFTANTMNCLTEALGMALPGSGTIPAVDARRIRLARETGRQVMGLFARDLRPSEIITGHTINNALVADMALGGSTNSILHLMAIAKEAGISFPLSSVNEIASKTPHLCKLSPAGEYRIEHLDLAGGMPALLKELQGLLNLRVKRVSGKTLGKELASAKNRNSSVIRSVSDPYSPMGGLCVLSGNLAPEGAVVKRAAVAEKMLKHRGPARVFDSEEEATRAIMENKFKSGDVLVIRYEGPRGGPGMREMLTPTALLSGAGSLGFGTDASGLARLASSWRSSVWVAQRTNRFLCLAETKLVEVVVQAAFEFCGQLGVTRCTTDRLASLETAISDLDSQEFGTNLLLSAWLAFSRKGRQSYSHWERRVVESLASSVRQ